MATATVTPGYIFANNELVTYPKLNALGNPGVAISITGTLNPQNYLRNGNFYGPYWNNAAGVSAPTATETGNAAFWTVNPSGAAVTYLQNGSVPNTHSLYSAEIIGATSVTTVNLSQTIPGDLSDTLNATVSFSCWILNNTGINLVPVLQISSANSLNNFSAVTQIGSTNLGTITSGQWAYETATINLTGLSNVNNGLKISIQFPSTSLSSNAQSVNVSQATLVVGSTSITYVDDFGMFPATPELNIVNAVLNGNLDVWQAGTSFATLTGTLVSKTADSWTVQTAGTLSVTHAQDTGASIAPLNNYYPYITNAGKITVQTAEASMGAADLLLMENKIEGYVMAPFQGRPLSLQFWVKTSLIGQYYVSLTNSNNSASYIAPYTVVTANVWQLVQIQNIPQMPTGTGTWNFTTGLGLQLTWALALGSTAQTISGNVGSWITTTGVYGTSAQVNVANNTSNTWEITGVQLEAGTVCNPLAFVPFVPQLMLCQRYFIKSVPYANAIGGVSSSGQYVVQTIASASVNQLPNIQFPQEMRIATTYGTNFTFYSPSAGTAARVDIGGTPATISSVSGISSKGLPNIALSSAAAANGQMTFHFVADARL
jgi:hypothetical protein